jgi:hypothetical protein
MGGQLLATIVISVFFLHQCFVIEARILQGTFLSSLVDTIQEQASAILNAHGKGNGTAIADAYDGETKSDNTTPAPYMPDDYDEDIVPDSDDDSDSSVWDKSGNFFTNAWDSISNFFTGIWTRITDGFSQLTPGELVALILGLILCMLFVCCCCCCRPLCYACARKDGCCRWFFVLVVGSIALGISFIATPLALVIAGCLGFTAAGVAANSCASRAQGFYGDVPRGSCFSGVQSFATRGRGYGSV